MSSPAPSPELGATAPNFDLTSTEGVVLMLRDEVVRTAIVLYFFAQEGERERRDLEALNARTEALRSRKARVLAVSPLPLETLRTLQRERKLRFPLLHDDRSFSASYGVASRAEGEPAPSALAVVDRRQALRFLALPLAAIETALPQAEAALEALPSPTQDYPKGIINRWIDRWVH
jgi:peroxiredoxin